MSSQFENLDRYNREFRSTSRKLTFEKRSLQDVNNKRGTVVLRSTPWLDASISYSKKQYAKQGAAKVSTRMTG